MSDTEESTVTVPSHPIVVVEYCKVCSLPTEYCEYGSSAKECLKANGPHPNNNKAAPSKSAPATTETTTTDDKNTTTTITSTSSTDNTEDKLKNLKIIDDSKETTHVDSTGTAAPAATEEKVVKKKKEVKPQIIIEVNQRNKRKHVTKITGLELYGIKLSDAAKVMAKKFSCGCSVVKSSTPNSEDIDIQGDFGEELVDLIEEKYPNISLNDIYFMEDKKKVKAR